MSPERYNPKNEPDVYYYLADEKQLMALEDELTNQGFYAEEFDDPEIDAVCNIYMDENGYSILTYAEIGSPGHYTVEVDVYITNLIDEMINGPTPDDERNKYTQLVDGVHKAFKLTPPNPNLADKIFDKLSRDRYDVWEGKTSEDIQILKDYLEKYYPYLEKFQKNDDEEACDIYQDPENSHIISITKMSFTNTPDKYRVKATFKLVPILVSLWGTENSPPISY